MKVLIMGAAGMIGRKLTDRLIGDGRIGDRGIDAMTLADVVVPPQPTGAGGVVSVATDLAAPGEADQLIADRPDVIVQLAAVASEQAAQAEWQRLSKRMPDLLGARKPTVQRVDRDGRTIWRVRTGGFADLAEATSFCARVRAKGASCSIAAF